jgi:hypothetical protein
MGGVNTDNSPTKKLYTVGIQGLSARVGDGDGATKQTADSLIRIDTCCLKPNKTLDTRIQPAPAAGSCSSLASTSAPFVPKKRGSSSAPVTSPVHGAAPSEHEHLGPRGGTRASTPRETPSSSRQRVGGVPPCAEPPPCAKGRSRDRLGALSPCPRFICPRTLTSRSPAYAISVLACTHIVKPKLRERGALGPAVLLQCSRPGLRLSHFLTPQAASAR